MLWTGVLEKTLESPLNYKEIQPVHPKGNQSLMFIGRTDAEAETPILWPSDATSWLIVKEPYAGRDWGQEEKGMTDDEMVGWHHQWTWAWVDSRSWWWTEKSGMLRFMGSQRVRHNWATELNWTELNNLPIHSTSTPHKSSLVSMCSLHMCLYFCFAKKIIYTIFRNSSRMC